MPKLTHAGRKSAWEGRERGEGARQLRGACEKGRAGFETGAPRLERMPERMESRPKARAG